MRPEQALQRKLCAVLRNRRCDLSFPYKATDMERNKQLPSPPTLTTLKPLRLKKVMWLEMGRPRLRLTGSGIVSFYLEFMVCFNQFKKQC